MVRLIAKLISVFLLFAAIVVSTLIPIKVTSLFTRQGQRGTTIISYLMCFGGGVFLSVYTLHMAPEARAIIDETLTRPLNTHYPIADFIMVCGFFMMLFVDTAVHKYSEGSAHSPLANVDFTDKSGAEQKKNNKNEPTLSPGEVESWSCSGPSVNDEHIGGDQPVVVSNTPMRTASGNCIQDGKRIQDSDNTNASAYSSILELGEKEAAVEIKCVPTNGSLTTVDKAEHETRYRGSEGTYDVDNETLSRLVDITMEVDMTDKGEQLSVHDSQPATRSLILLIALSLHHAFEGLTVGLKRTEPDVWSLVVAILSHEIIIAFSLGMHLVKSYEKTSQVVVAGVVCSIMVPIGIIVGTILTETGNQQSGSILLANGILQSLSTGVFIYVTFFEILQPELGSNHGHPSFYKLLCMLLGFLCLALLVLIPEDKSLGTEAGVSLLSLANETVGLISTDVAAR